MLQMVYTTNDIIYRQDIDDLNKKIKLLAKHIIKMMSLRRIYAFVEEVNTLLADKDALKTDLSEYRKMNVFSYSHYKELKIKYDYVC